MAATPDNSDLSVIGKGMHVGGNCVSPGRLRIQGRVTGSVTAAGIELLTEGAIEGDILAEKAGGPASPVVINGFVSGNVRAHYLEIGPAGSVEGDLEASEIVIRGQVHGAVVARDRLAVDRTAVVVGDIETPRFALKEGGQVEGTIRMGAAVASGRADLTIVPTESPEADAEVAETEEAEELVAVAV